MPLDLTSASREELLALIAQQAEIIAQLQARVHALEERLNSRGGPGMPGNKPVALKSKGPKAARKKRDHNHARQCLTPTESVEHAVESCPACGTTLCGGWVQRTRQVVEIPVSPVRVIEHRFLARICPVCNKRRVPRASAVLSGVTIGRQSFGINLVSLILTLREEGRLPMKTIPWLVQTLYQVSLSAGEIAQMIQSVARRAEPAVTTIRDKIRGSPVMHADETGWREDGTNGYVWTFCTPTERYFVRGKRDKAMVDAALGDSFAGVLVTDFYAAYNHYDGPHQRCWSHLLRDIHALTDLYPTDTGLVQWATDVHALYLEGKAVVSTDERERERTQLDLETRLASLCHALARDPLAVQARLCRRILSFLKELFMYVRDPRVPADNNLAERSLRHLVTSRKISGGTRSKEGSTSKMWLASLFGTWRAQGLDPFPTCCSFLATL
jgi:transposase